MTKQHYIKEAICGYKEAIAFTDCQEGDETANARWSREMLAAITQDVTAFITENYALLQQADMTGTQTGIDFWLSRNGHGGGFFDRGLGELGEQLQGAAEAYGVKEVYLGDNGKVYFA